MISWYLRDIKTEEKQITPTKWANKWKEITIFNLILEMVDDEWSMEVQIPLYSTLSRNIMNSLAWPDALEEIYLSVYNNKQGFRSISIKKEDSREQTAFYVPYYTREQELWMIEMKKEKGQEKKDYDKLTDKYIEELLPIIQKKIENQIIWIGNEEKQEEIKQEEVNPEDEDDLPF